MKNKCLFLKIAALSVFILIGGESKTYSQLFTLRQVQPAYQQAANQTCVYHLIDSCLRAAEKKGVRYRPKDYFRDLKIINAAGKKYDVAIPADMVGALAVMMRQERALLSDDLKREIAASHPPEKKISLGDLGRSLLKGFIVLSTLALILLFIRFAPFITLRVIRAWPEMKTYAKLLFQSLRGTPVLLVFCQENRRYFWYQSRAPSDYHPDIDKVPWVY